MTILTFFFLSPLESPIFMEVQCKIALEEHFFYCISNSLWKSFFFFVTFVSNNIIAFYTIFISQTSTEKHCKIWLKNLVHGTLLSFFFAKLLFPWHKLWSANPQFNSGLTVKLLRIHLCNGKSKIQFFRSVDLEYKRQSKVAINSIWLMTGNPQETSSRGFQFDRCESTGILARFSHFLSEGHRNWHSTNIWTLTTPTRLKSTGFWVTQISHWGETRANDDDDDEEMPRDWACVILKWENGPSD